MKKIIGLVLAAVMLCMLTIPATAAVLEKDMYVYTQNGKGLYVRSSMSTASKDNIIGSLPYGTKVHTYGGNFNGWTMIDYGDGDAYVMYRFLTEKKPAPYTPSPDPVPADTMNSTTVAQMNSLVTSVRTVTPYTVTVRPTRASGWVYMRWFPSRNAEAMATYGANNELTVIAVLNDWYQVTDPETGMVGFIYKSYVQ